MEVKNNTHLPNIPQEHPIDKRFLFWIMSEESFIFMEFYKGIVSPVLDKLDSETMHVAAKNALHLAESNSVGLKLLEQFAYGRKRFYSIRLPLVLGEVDRSGIVQLDNPVMVGAGWDKTGSAVRGLWQLGFSAEEVGTVPEHRSEEHTSELQSPILISRMPSSA